MAFWDKITGPELCQGDLLPDCVIPRVPVGFWDKWEKDENSSGKVEGLRSQLIIITQTCDLVKREGVIERVILCRAYELDEQFPREWSNKDKKRLESIRKGRFPALHMIGATTESENTRHEKILDFREIFVLPRAYLIQHAESLGDRHRLLSPYREHFSQAFARYFMRVGLPSDIPSFG